MKIRLGLIIGAILLVTPFNGSAAVNTIFNSNGSAPVTGTDTQLDVVLDNYEVSNEVSVLTIVDSQVTDIKSAAFLDKSGWVQLSPYQNGIDVLAKFISDTGFVTNNQRVISLRINFKTPKTYILGYSLTGISGQTLSSAAIPINVTGPAILGEHLSNSYKFPRILSNGSRGADVTELQNRLSTEGFYKGPITGYYGAQTRAAVKAYQIAKAIAGANGVVGPATLGILNQ